MKVIIDTNILISAILKGKIPRIIIQFLIDSDDYKWIVSTEILAEYKSVLSRPKFKLSQEIISQWCDVLDIVTNLIEFKLDVNFPRDQKDAKFLACALASKADFLITGDKDFEDIKVLGNTKIISVSQFKTLVIDHISN